MSKILSGRELVPIDLVDKEPILERLWFHTSGLVDKAMYGADTFSRSKETFFNDIREFLTNEGYVDSDDELKTMAAGMFYALAREKIFEHEWQAESLRSSITDVRSWR